jgi:hypothetical protein
MWSVGCYAFIVNLFGYILFRLMAMRIFLLDGILRNSWIQIYWLSANFRLVVRMTKI